MTKTQCAIWQTPCEKIGRNPGRDLDQFDSARAGGKYEISGTATAVLNSHQSVRSRLTTWIVDQHRFGVEWPLITSTVIEQVEARRHLRISEKIERFFQYLASSEHGLGSRFEFYGTQPQTALAQLAAWTECESTHDTYALLDLLRDSGFIMIQMGGEARLTPDGFARLEQAGSGGAPTTQAFVAMWFSDKLQEAYDQGFATAISAAGYRPMRIDRKEHSGKIDDEIIAEIRRSRFVVADFTCEILNSESSIHAIARGGVYYEAGFSQGIGTPLIWSVRSDCIDYVHFDTRQYAHIVWDTPHDLRKKLYHRIAAVIGEAPGAPGLSG